MEVIKITGKLTGNNASIPVVGTLADLVGISYHQEVMLDTQERSFSKGSEVELSGVTADTLLELEFGNGYKRWIRARALTPQTLQGAKFLRVLAITLPEGMPTETLLQTLEQDQVAAPGLCKCSDSSVLSLQAVAGEADLDSSKPTLLFIHDAFANTRASFGALWESREGYNATVWLKRLFAPYAEQVFTFEHPTLSVTPVRNALQVLRQLPANARLHLMTHGRGGLIGELLCQGSLQRREATPEAEYTDTQTIFSDKELRGFDAATLRSDAEDLREIARLLSEKNIRVERFVRVACPARGTALITDALENTLSVLFNALDVTRIKRLQDMAQSVRLALLCVLQQRQGVEALPGLAALMPTAPLIRLLNRPGVRVRDSALVVIAGNAKISNVLGQLKPWIATHFAGEPNDFVVNTLSMYGGLERTLGKYVYSDQRDSSSHFGYFRDTHVLERVLNGLTHPEQDVLLQYLPVQVLAPALERSARSAVDNANVVYFVPGFMGSSLQVNERPVWLDMGELSWGEFTSLKITQAGVQAGEVLNVYRPLLNALSGAYRVETFAYDWRRSVLDAARDFGGKLEQALEAAQLAQRKLSLRLLAHSTGGMVLMALMSELPGLWKRLQEEADCRCVLLGTPLQGSFAAVQMVLGKHRLIRLLDLLDGKALDEKAFAAQFAAWPGLLEQLPEAYLQEAPWQALLGNDFATWAARRLLPDALQVRAQLRAVTLDTQRVVYVHGSAPLTPSGVVMDDAVPRFKASVEGDGVTLYSSVNWRGQQWFMPVEHGCLATQPEYFSALLDLLGEGKTHQLDQIPPPTTARGEQWLPTIEAELFPDEAELQAAALGYHTIMTQEEVRPQIEVRVMHGDLEYVAHPIVVGHYDGDSIVSTERVLDKCLGGRLSELMRLGQYPGPLKTSEVVLNPGKRPGGAVVVGLGDVGKLTPSHLTASIADALVYYALMVRSHLGNVVTNNVTEITPVHVTSLLIGTVAGGVSLADSIAATLRAVGRANLVLEKTEQNARVRLASLDFLELYEDRAVEAARLIRCMTTYPEFRRDFKAGTLMGVLPGNRRRVMYRDSGSWWRRLQIEAYEEGLKYTALTDRARAEMRLQATQRKFVDQFINKAVATSKADPELSKTLFELLLPTEIKEQAPQGDNLVLVLDEETSAYPWELLHDRRSPESQPMSVRSGMLRQLVVEHPRRVRNTNKDMALVIGDPPVDAGFAQLDAAYQEAKNITQLLGKWDFQVVSKIRKPSIEIITALLAEDYRIVHLAGHGVYQYESPSEPGKRVTGMVLGDGAFLTAAEIEQMGCVPDFVFINCCHLAKMDFSTQAVRDAITQDRSKLAASFAQQLIELGVKAVVAAGWAIHDGAAQVFSETCYNHLLRGETFGTAIVEARREAWRLHSNTNTWGAYQCYGDPEYRLRPLIHRDGHSAQQTDQWQFVAEVEAIAELQNLSNAADTSNTDEYPLLQERLALLHKAIPAEWLSHSLVLYALGRAYGKLDKYMEALEAYRVAIESPDSDYPLRLLEDKVNLQTSFALACALHPQTVLPPDWLGDTQTCEQLITHLLQDSKLSLTHLEKLGSSLERMEEEGKYYKRLAMIVTDDKRTHALRDMEAAYKRAHEFALEKTGQVAVYPLINWLTARMVRWRRENIKQLDRVEMKEWLDKAQEQAEKAERRSPNFLTGITLAECALLQYLLSARLEETVQLERIGSFYAEAIARGTAPRKSRYVSEHLTFVRLMLEGYLVENVVVSLHQMEGRLAV
ncbi:CHAT domain-containing protein [Candidatus Thiothrix anitrata]|uniref:CHAT domain-containing protein n=1 Tax=Candidatus Thiothrix anitrata TaxID=2823902 RepID=A0ABX7X2T1_9GAMM|nr:CHAT domain-containing protein [Candidatus Thiothrix anitrata]QTR48918.1 CHAT domain-containing protein [Candidatus Thiothrix anitrata]